MSPGDTIGHYRIVAPLGSGGAGEVYEAFDDRLNRRVAIKLLSDSERVLEEARAAGALDHPNLLTVHDVGHIEGRSYLVTQLVEGRTLRALLGGRRLGLDEALDIALQIARGLAAAHDAGILHRDLKPENVMVDDTRTVKILDFGIASREIDEDGEAVTVERVVSGTPGYMAPEQAQGKGTDSRADVFAFGALLYELVTGERAFRGTTATEVLTAVLRDEPKPIAGPEELRKLVARALRKDPARRPRSMADITLVLEDLRRELAEPRSRSFVLWAAVAAAGALVAGTLWLRPSPPPLRVAPITSFPGTESDAAFSPDGTRVAFVWNGEDDEREHPTLYVTLADASAAPLELAERAHEPAWSPDARRIAFLRHDPEDPEQARHDVVAVPALGGREEILGRTVSAGHGLSWSPDGRFLAVRHRETPKELDAIFLLEQDSGELRRLTSPVHPAADKLPAFSPDGRRLAYVHGDPPASILSVVSSDGGTPRTLFTTDLGIDDLDWTPGGDGLLYLSEGEVWTIGAAGGDPTPLQLPFSPRELAVSRSDEHERLLFRERRTDSALYRIPGPLAEGEDSSSAPERLIASTRIDTQPHYSPDGRAIAFLSTRSGTPQIWVCDEDGGNCRAITDSPFDKRDPRWSPDGESILFTGFEEGRSNLWLVGADGAIPKKLTDDAFVNFASSWSGDGRFVYFVSSRGGALQIWKIPSAGGEPLRVTENAGHFPAESEDGRYIYYKPDPNDAGPIWRAQVDGGSEELWVDAALPSPLVVWRDKAVFLSSEPSRGHSIRMLDLLAGESSELAWVGPDRVNLSYGDLAVSPDGRSILLRREETRGGDLLLAENYRSSGPRGLSRRGRSSDPR